MVNVRLQCVDGSPLLQRGGSLRVGVELLIYIFRIYTHFYVDIIFKLRHKRELNKCIVVFFLLSSIKIFTFACTVGNRKTIEEGTYKCN